MNGSYVAYFTDVFKENLKKITKKNFGFNERIEKKIKEMLADPFRGSIFLVGLGKGKLRIRVGDYRLIFTVCHKCRGKGLERFNQCGDCKNKADNSIIYFDIQHRKHAYD